MRKQAKSICTCRNVIYLVPQTPSKSGTISSQLEIAVSFAITAVALLLYCVNIFPMNFPPMQSQMLHFSSSFLHFQLEWMLVDGAAAVLVVGVVQLQCPPPYTIITGCFSIQIFIDFDTYLLRYLSMSFKGLCVWQLVFTCVGTPCV